MNYFKILCFIWALIGIVSRIIMSVMGDKWKEWELNSAYKSKRPPSITIIALLGYLLVIVTWYMVWLTRIEKSWIIAALTSLIAIKISSIIFNYDSFRAFASKTLNNKRKMQILNIGVIIYSLVLLFMGLLIY